MGAPERNNFWTKRATHGRDKIFQSPEMFWECSCEYFQHVDENPYLEQNWVGKDGNEVLKNIIKPYTLQGLAIFLRCSTETINNYGKKVGYEDFFEIVTHVKEIIYNQKFSGAAAGLFNSSIIARDLGLKEKQEIDYREIETIDEIEIVHTKK